MGLITTRTDLKNTIAAQETQISELEADLEASEATVTELRTELAEAKEANATFPSAEAIAAIEKERDEALALAAPEKIYAAAIAIINGTGGSEAQKAEVTKLIASRVTEQLASAGQSEPVEDNGDKDLPTSKKTEADKEAESAAATARALKNWSK